MRKGEDVRAEERRASAGGFREYLAPVAAGVSPGLISASAFEDIDAVARRIPEPLAYSTFGFECRLGETAPRADFLVLATAAQGRKSLATLDAQEENSAAALTAHPVWRRVRDFAELWADPSSLLHEAADNVWLEFDVDGPPSETPVPAVFFGIMPNASPEVLPTALRVLSGDGMAPQILEKVSEYQRFMPPFGDVFQVGLMLSRGPVEAVRLCIWFHSPEKLLPFLQRVGWRGDEDLARAALAPLRRMVDTIALNVDVGAVVHDKLGFECYFHKFRQPGREPRWKDFLDFLVREGLCTARKRDALLVYPGHVEEDGATPWPGALSRASALLGSRYVSAFARTLHHVKVVYESGRPVEAKAYLAGNHLWRAGGS